MLTLTTVSTASLLLPALTDSAGWRDLFAHPHFWWGLAGVGVLAGISWVLVRRMATAFSPQLNGIDVLFGSRVIDGVIFPLVWLILTVFLRAAMIAAGLDTVGLMYEKYFTRLQTLWGKGWYELNSIPLVEED